LDFGLTPTFPEDIAARWPEIAGSPLFEQVEDGAQGAALLFVLLLDAFDREDAEVSVLGADLLLDVSGATVPPALHSIDVSELEDSNPIGQGGT
jgi:hypothetical protein